MSASRILFLVAGLLMFFMTNRVVGFRVGLVVPWLLLSLILCALGLYSLRLCSRLIYGVIEFLAAGVGGTLIAIDAYGAAQMREYVPIVGGGIYHRPPEGVLPWSGPTIALFGMLAAIYVLVQGLDDIGEGLRKHPKWHAQWQRCFGDHLSR
jgi:hypothetical protein